MKAKRPVGLILALAVAACAPPVVVLVAALGARTGVWDAQLAHDGVAWGLGPILAGLGLLLGLAAAVLSVRSRSGRLAAVVATIVSLSTVGVYVWRYASLVDGPDAVTTDRAELPGWGPLAGRRGQGGPEGFADCPAARSVPTQAVPEVVVYVLQKHGVDVVRAGVTGVYGVRPGFWFGFDQDVAVRIRPGRTDIRIAARSVQRHDSGACRLAARIADDLTID